MIGSKGLHRGNETIGSMSESRFKEAYLEEYDVQDKAWCRRNRAYLLMLHVAVVLVLPRAWRQDEPARVLRDESWRRGWAVEVARREQQREQQREADARAAAAVATAATAAAAKAGVNESGREMAPAAAVGQEMSSTGGGGGAASLSEASKTAGLLDEYVCPITAEIMTDPVCTLDGFTYERKAITEWLRTSDTSPATGARLESKNVIPNITVRCLLRRL